MRKWLILLSAMSATSASSAPAWTWVDANGQVHFSDRPVPGAKQIEIAGAQGFGGAAAPAGSQGSAARPPTTPPPGAPVGLYQTIEITSPAEQETLRNIGTVLNVQVRFQPNLQPGHRFDLLLDGQRRNVNTASARVALPDVFRGTHTLQVVVLDPAGTELARSPVRNFIVMQTSLLGPANPNNPNNPNRAPARP